MERWNHKAPDLPEHHRKGQQQAAVHRYGNAGREPIERSEAKELAVALQIWFGCAQVFVRLHQETKHRIVEREHKNHAEGDRQHAAHDANPKLGKVVA